MSRKIRKDKVLAALVRVFFKYFTTGIVEQAGKAMADMEPKDLKMIMLNHFEDISKIFNQEAFYSITRMNYDSDSMERQLRDFIKPGMTDMDLVRFSCKTEGFYNAMVEEYRRNFCLLLSGCIASAEEHEKSYTRCDEAGEMDYELAESIINRMAVNAYSKGLSEGKTKTATADNS